MAVALAVSETCNTANLPAMAGVWASSVADEFLVDWEGRTLGVKPAAATTPADAIHRRRARWRLAPRPSAALDSLVRSGARQVLHKRSWQMQRD